MQARMTGKIDNSPNTGILHGEQDLQLVIVHAVPRSSKYILMMNFSENSSQLDIGTYATKPFL